MLPMIVFVICTFIALGILLSVLLDERPVTPRRVEEDLAQPYREGLHAAARLQVVAQELERQMYVEAARQQLGRASSSDIEGAA